MLELKKLYKVGCLCGINCNSGYANLSDWKQANITALGPVRQGNIFFDDYCGMNGKGFWLYSKASYTLQSPQCICVAF